MVKTKPLTKSGLVTALKATEERIFEERTEFFVKMIKPLFDKLSGRLEKVEVDVKHLRQGQNELKAELSDTPSRKQFNDLRDKVIRHHPTQ